MHLPSEREIEAAKTPRGGWTRAQLAEWGVPWPPPKGWKAALLAESDKPNPPAERTGRDAHPLGPLVKK
jgi:hypothetical protein